MFLIKSSACYISKFNLELLDSLESTVIFLRDNTKKNNMELPMLEDFSIIIEEYKIFTFNYTHQPKNYSIRSAIALIVPFLNIHK